MKLPSAIRAARSSIVRSIRPTVVPAYKANRKINEPADDSRLLRATWEQFRGTLNGEESRRADEALVTAYNTALSRQSGLEAKAVGAIQAATIVAAAQIYGATGPLTAKTLAVVGLCYLAASVATASYVLLPRQRTTLTADDIREGGSLGFIEMAESAELMNSVSLVTSNWVTASLIDLGRAAFFGAAAALVTVFLK
jgi:hypothetical protein